MAEGLVFREDERMLIKTLGDGVATLILARLRNDRGVHAETAISAAATP